MKRVAVLAANGKVGRLLVREALLQGASVSAFVRGDFDRQWLAESLAQNLNGAEQEALLERLCVVKKDIFALSSSDLAGFDVVLDAFGEWENLGLYQQHIAHLAGILRGANAEGKLFVVGGAGSLYVDSSTQLLDSANFPAEYKPLALAHKGVLEYLRGVEDVAWCFVSPAAMFVPDMPQGAKVQILGEQFATNAKGESVIGYADYARTLCTLALDANVGQYAKKHISLIAQ